MGKFYLWIAAFFALVIGSWFVVKQTVPKQHVRVYPALATAIPADTKILAGLQIEKIKQTRLFKKLVEERQIPAIDRFARETGIDIRKNVYEVVLASNGTDTIVLASGKFAELSSSTGQNTQELRPHTQIQGERMVLMPYKGMSLIGNPNAAACFLNNATVMAGSTQALKRAIDLREKNPMAPQDLLALARGLPGEDQFWLVSTLGIDRMLPSIPLGSFGKMRSIPVKLDRVTGSGQVGLGFHLKLALDSSDAKSIEQMSTALKGLVALARINTPETERELMRLLDSVRVGADDKTVRVGLDVPDDLIEKFLNDRRFTSSAPE